ncbi:rRNA small subunit 7-methylguanosine (m7G) methyltransferase GidB [Chitinispirillum alkaliphilum]|nr:rRNA small subunit 7-methylguanosine (m7G) methyltransferase GidB [Chitinispirillum alkaliphilum]
MDAVLKPFLERAKKAYELKELERLGLTPELEQREQILEYICLLLKWNDDAGLVSKNDEESLFLRHFCDSLQPLLLFGFKKNALVLDIGSGGGFPSIPIRIFRPDLSFVLAESNRKKASFLNEVKKSLELDNLEVFNGKVERYNTEEKKFDYVISRGFGSLQKFSQLAKPMVKPDGHMYTFKTKKFTSELDFITNNKETDGIKIREIAEYDLGNIILGLNLVSLEICDVVENPA